MERRAAFDVGSGSTKILICDVDSITNKIIQTIHGVERPMAYGIALQQSADSMLNEETQLKGLKILLELKQLAIEQYSCTKFAACATEVFRKAKNGMSMLNTLKTVSEIQIVLIDQELEAELGFLSVAAVSGQTLKETCAWDSGGASFQITSFSELRENGAIVLQRYMGLIGTSVALSVLLQVQGRSLETVGDVKAPGAVNPVNRDLKDLLIAAMTARLPPGPVPAWLRGREQVTGACGRNSIFNVCAEILRISGLVEISNATTVVTQFTREEAEMALHVSLGCSDEELQRYQQFEHAEGVHVVVCKLVLLVAVMRHLDIQSIFNVDVVGLCPGIIETRRFWTQCK